MFVRNIFLILMLLWSGGFRPSQGCCGQRRIMTVCLLTFKGDDEDVDILCFSIVTANMNHTDTE